MSWQLPPLSAERDVHQVLLVKETLEGPGQLHLVVVPLETESLVHDMSSADTVTAQTRADSFSAWCQCIDLQCGASASALWEPRRTSLATFLGRFEINFKFS